MKTKLLLFLLLLSLTITAQTNLVPNGDFENWSSSSQPDNWYRYFSGYVSQSASAQSGKSSINMRIASGTYNYINSEYFPVQANKTYRITIYHRLLNGVFSSIDLSLYHKPGTFKEEIIKKSNVTFSNLEWRKIEFEYTSQVSENIEVDIWTTGSLNSEILIDNVSVVDIADVPLQYTSIPDIEFEKRLISLGLDSGATDGKVLTSTIKTVKSLTIDPSIVSDLTGIEDFESLESLTCNASSYTGAGGNGKLKTINISKNVNLTSLGIGGNQISSLDISNNPKLTTLSMSYNKISSLNTSANPALTYLLVSNNPITTLDISNNLALTYLYFGSTSLTSLNISKLTNLRELDIQGLKWTTLDISNNLNLVVLSCGFNRLTSLNVSKHTQLLYLHCDSNQLTSLDLSTNKNLLRLTADSNRLTTLDLSKNAALTSISCNGNSEMTTLNLQNGKNSQITSIDLQNNPSLSCVLVDDVVYSNTNWAKFKDASASYSNSCPLVYTAIPDIEFEKKLISLGLDAGATDGKVLTSNIKTVKSLTVDTRVISDLTGIQDFEALETLSATGGGHVINGDSDGKLTKLDLSKNINLTSLSCNSNKLTSLDVSNNTKLTSLILNGNKITTINITNNPYLQRLSFSSTLISNMDISKHQALTLFDCSYSKIKAIDVSKNPGLQVLDVSGNGLTTLDVSKNINVYNFYCDANSLTSIDISKNLSLLNFSCYNNPLTNIDLSNNILLASVNFGATAITSIDLSKNINLTSVNCGSAQLTTIDVSKNLKLRYFNANSSQFKSIDLSKNINLTTVFCQFNQVLNEINLKNGNNTKLTNGNVALNGNPGLYCIQVDDVNYSTQNWTKKDAYIDYTAAACTTPSYTLIPDAEFEKLLIEKGIDGIQDGKVLTNRIAKIKVLNLSNTNAKYKIQDLTGIQDFEALEELKFPNNYEANVATVNLSKNQFLKKLDCRQSGIVTLDVSKNTALTDLNCYGNILTSLDVSKNIALTNLDCSYNRLTALDVSNNINLKSLYCSSSNKEGVFSLQQGLLTSLDVSKNSALEFLDCSMNEKLVGLDVSKNSNLTSINVSNNKLTSIDFSANKLLKSISCENNQITNLDLSKYPALESLRCSYNQLTILDISQKPALKVLMCSYNHLTNLDVSKNPALETFYCDNNKLTILDLSANPNLKQIICGSNNLTKLNLKNGGNKKVSTTIFSTFANNPNLSCITVDDADYANKTWATFKDSNANYNTECGFSLPSKNFTVESKGESCLGENNGEITITASAQLSYVANINGKTSAFTNNALKVNNLTPGTYTIIVTIPGEIYEQTFTLAIAKGATITGKSSITSKTVDVEITEGTAPFTVFVDGTEQFQTNDASFSVDVTKNALVEVSTAKACEGVFAKKVSFSDFESGVVSAYPNPTSGYFEIEIPGAKKEVKIELYNFSGQLVSAKTYVVESGKALLNLENQASGIYAAKIILDTPEYLKIIKK